MNGDYTDIIKMGLKKGKGWPDEDVMETLPKILNNLLELGSPTGFESWLIIKKNSLEIIGDLGFKGFDATEGNIDIGYGIIKEERKKGYATEAVTTLIQWAFSNEMVKEITARCLLDNTSSIELLKKCRFTAINKDNEMLYWSLQNSHHKELS